MRTRRERAVGEDNRKRLSGIQDELALAMSLNRIADSLRGEEELSNGVADAVCMPSDSWSFEGSGGSDERRWRIWLRVKRASALGEGFKSLCERLQPVKRSGS